MVIDEGTIEANYVWAVINRYKDFDSDIKPEFFENSILRSIMERIHQLYNEGFTVWDFANIYFKFKRADDREWLAANTESPVSEVFIDQYKEFLFKRYRQKLVQNLANSMLSESGEVDPQIFQSKLTEKLQNTKIKTNAKHAKQLAQELFSHIEKAKESGGLTGINCGFRVFNELFNGFQPGRLYVLAARPSMGKSALMLNFALNAAKTKKHVYVHCLEESLVSFTSRMLSHISMIDNESIQRGRFNDAQWTPIVEATTKLASLNLTVNDKPNVTARQIVEEIKSCHIKNNIDIVFIDHIQDIARTNDSWHHDISESCGLFKALAKDLNIPVLIISQLNRGVEQRQDKRPILSDLKESGDIEAKADVVFLMYRDEYYNPNTLDKGIVEIKVSKNRDGRIGMLRLSWDAAHMKFGEVF